MPDITKCTRQDCPVKDKCYRYTCPPGKRQSYFIPDPGPKGCGYFMPNQTDSKKNTGNDD